MIDEIVEHIAFYKGSDEANEENKEEIERFVSKHRKRFSGKTKDFEKDLKNLIVNIV